MNPFIQHMYRKYPDRNWSTIYEWYQTNDPQIQIAQRMCIEREYKNFYPTNNEQTDGNQN